MPYLLKRFVLNLTPLTLWKTGFATDHMHILLITPPEATHEEINYYITFKNFESLKSINR